MQSTIGENVRHTWQQIEQLYPDKWALMKEAEFDRGNLVSAVVVFTCDDQWDINRFMEENPDKLAHEMACFYTGETVPVEDYSEFGEVELYDATGVA